MRDINEIVEKKEGSKWIETYRTVDAAKIYSNLAHALINKKINECTYINSIRRSQNYDGTITITVYYENGIRDIFTVEE